MPFLDDSGPRPEQERGLLWRSVALIGDQLERMVALNVAWALQSVPLMAAWAFPGLPAWFRLALTFYTALAFIPASATLFDALTQTSDGLPLSVDLVLEAFKAQFKPSFLKLLPLYSLFYWLGLAAWFSAQNNLLLVDVLARLLILFTAVLSLYWGGLFVAQPELSALGILRRSLALFWRQPGQTLLAALLSLLALALGIVSIGGMLLIVSVLLALIQVQLVRKV